MDKVNYSLITFQNKTKYILLWTRASASPFVYLEKGNSVFVKKNCEWKNCFVTNNPGYLGDVTEFEVIAFNGPQISQMIAHKNIPLRRSLSQKYVYANIESAANYPICTEVWNEFFNWTWTYKLDSDALWGYFAIRNFTNHIIGPSKNINWLSQDAMVDIDEGFKTRLKTKNRAAAWFVSSCVSSSMREEYVEKLQKHLKRYNLMIHIYGKCGEYDCPVEQMPKCLKMLQRNYYFYLAFENALSEDYVTEKIIYALQHDTVPIVLGGANYSRFLPDGSYMNAAELKPAKLAMKIYQIIRSPTLYHKFFRWKNYYSYHFRHESPQTDDYCNFCAMLNDEHLMKSTTIYDNFNYWWTGANMKNICHSTLDSGVYY
ncbi:unnamed protein product [Chilo suppressalis]|uniref:Fucosyltransferase n=1 Tax=Chilo suppressalis TaxID=168631 RepID=A0ABN8B560_CHISP|nr:hypothetical protein evm_008504 [Chilo suppressalis]CAH0401993.1 unnamed protein product [Chilo suppressalis]